jgi:SPP1 gp7 family putative phage head morphogenesis protein
MAEGIAETVQRIAVRGMAEGKGAIAIAREVRMAVQAMPRSAAEAIMRTAQMTAYRQATTASYMANADILEPQAIRVAALDARTCMACVALHGTLVPLDQPIAEHWNGRCTTVAQVRGRRRIVQTGNDWLSGLSEAQQRAQMGQAAYEAWRAGALRLADFVQKRSDPIFGEMIQQASLRGILGDGAKEFYKRRDAK